MVNEQLAEALGPILRALGEADRAREKGLTTHRHAIREASLAIRAVHRGDLQTAEQHLQEGRRALARARESLLPHPEVYHAGFLQDAEKEVAEAGITFHLVTSGRLPQPEELGVTGAPYLHGLAESVGELRRHILDRMRRGEVEESEGILETMDEIYYVLTTIDFPDALTRGLRRSTDIARGCLEKTRGDMTSHRGQLRLERQMRALGELLESPRG